MNNKNNVTENDPTEGLDDLILMPKEMKDVNGESFEIPVPNWGMELQVIRTMGVLLQKVKDDIDIPLSQIKELAKEENKPKLNSIVFKLMQEAPDEITKIVSKILAKDVAFVEKQLDLSIITEILLPFLLTRMDVLAKAMERMDANFGQLMQGLSVSPSPTLRKKRSH